MENGASACTTFATNETIDFGNSTLEAGKYSIYTIPSKNEWTIIVIKILRCMGQQVMMKRKMFSFYCSS
jgi:hypothetical protein